MDWMPLHLSSHYYGVLLRIQSRGVSSAKLPTCTAHMGALLGIVSMDYRQLSLSIFLCFLIRNFGIWSNIGPTNFASSIPENYRGPYGRPIHVLQRWTHIASLEEVKLFNKISYSPYCMSIWEQHFYSSFATTPRHDACVLRKRAEYIFLPRMIAAAETLCTSGNEYEVYRPIRWFT
jgi:hypothetical protein